MIRYILALLVLGAGLWLFHDISFTHGLLVGRGQDDPTLFWNDPVYSLRFVGGLGLILGGALSLKGKWPGFALALLGSACFAALSAGMIMRGADISLWQDDALMTAGLLILCAALFKARRN